jgi:hypothetical protein
MYRDPYDIAIDRILEGADGDVRLALRAVLRESLQLELRLRALSDEKSIRYDPIPAPKRSLN